MSFSQSSSNRPFGVLRLLPDGVVEYDGSGMI